MQDLMGLTFMGITALDWAIAAVVFLLAIGVARLVITVVIARLEALAGRTETDLDDLIVRLVRGTRTLFLLLIAVWLASQSLDVSQGVADGIRTALIIGLLVQAALWGSAGIGYLIERYRKSQLEADPAGATAMGAMAVIGKAMVWAVVVLLILDNLSIDVAALVAGLGIGGVAVALALQSVLSDLFASLSIVLDKPFVVGDFVIVGEFFGTVEYVGLKSTRLRSLSGEQVIFSNSDLLGSRIRNYKRMAERRVVFQLGVTYDTPSAKLERIPQMIRDVVDSHDKTRFDRSHFKAYGPSSLDFETVYHMLVPDYNSMMDVQQAINLEIYRRFEQEGIEFAYPTQTLYVHRQGPEPSAIAAPAQS